MSFQYHSYKKRNRDSRGNLAEFGPALLLFLVVIIVPLVALMRLGCAAIAMSFIVGRCADAAATGSTYKSAQKETRRVATELSHSPLWGLSGLRPDAMKTIDLYIDEQILATGQKNVYGADRPIVKSISSSINTYEFEVRASFLLEPLFAMGSTPIFGKVPLLSSPAVITASAVRAVEYPDGLTFEPQ